MDFEYYEYKVFPVSERILTWNEDPANGGRGTCITPLINIRLVRIEKTLIMIIRMEVWIIW